MCTKSTAGSDKTSKTRVALIDPERVADGVERLLRAPADRVHVSVGMPIVNRYELRAEAKADDGNVEDLRHEGVTKFDLLAGAVL